MGHLAEARGRGRDTAGTVSLKRLAAGVLARDSGRDTRRDASAYAVPPPPAAVPPRPAPAPPSIAYLPGVPRAWCEGVAALASTPPPDSIPAARWAALAATSARLLRDHGASLHKAGWDALDLFGLHRTHPGTNPPAQGLAWLLGAAGDVLDVASDTLWLRRDRDGGRMTFRRPTDAARIEAEPAWLLGQSG